MVNNGKFYKITFWFSRSFTFLVSFLAVFAALNIKYLFLDSFFTDILCISGDISKFIMKNLGATKAEYLFNLSFYAPSKSNASQKQFFYDCFVFNSQNIDVLITVFLIIIFVFILFKIFFNKKNILVFNLLLIHGVYLIMYFMLSLKILLVLSLAAPLVYFIVYFINNKNLNCIKLALIPFIGEICFIKYIIKYILPNILLKDIGLIVLAISLFVSNTFAFLSPFSKAKVTPYINIQTTFICKDVLRNKLIINAENKIFVVHNNTIKLVKIPFYSLNFHFNKYKDEFYSFDNRKGIFYILDGDTFNIKKEKILKNSSYVDRSTDFSFDNAQNIGLLICEDTNPDYLIDINSLEIIKTFEAIKDIHPPVDSVCYNKFRNSFFISTFQIVPAIQEVLLNENKVNIIDSYEGQGYICVSDRNKEVYVPFSQRGKIGVYDAETFKLKRYIKSGYTVKDISYDEELNIIIAPEYFTGRVKIFLMDGTDKLLYDKFVGYRLRIGMFDSEYKNLYVCSQNGLYKVKIDIKNIIDNLN